MSNKINTAPESISGDEQMNPDQSEILPQKRKPPINLFRVSTCLKIKALLGNLAAKRLATMKERTIQMQNEILNGLRDTNDFSALNTGVGFVESLQTADHLDQLFDTLSVRKCVEKGYMPLEAIQDLIEHFTENIFENLRELLDIVQNNPKDSALKVTRYLHQSQLSGELDPDSQYNKLLEEVGEGSKMKLFEFEEEQEEEQEEIDEDLALLQTIEEQIDYLATVHSKSRYAQSKKYKLQEELIRVKWPLIEEEIKQELEKFATVEERLEYLNKRKINHPNLSGLESQIVRDLISNIDEQIINKKYKEFIESFKLPQNNIELDSGSKKRKVVPLICRKIDGKTDTDQEIIDKHSFPAKWPWDKSYRKGEDVPHRLTIFFIDENTGKTLGELVWSRGVARGFHFNAEYLKDMIKGSHTDGGALIIDAKRFTYEDVEKIIKQLKEAIELYEKVVQDYDLDWNEEIFFHDIEIQDPTKRAHCCHDNHVYPGCQRYGLFLKKSEDGKMTPHCMALADCA